jgi:uncharacterized YigZ family protein
MQCVKGSFTAEEIIKKSRFISLIAPCADESEARRFLARLHLEHPNASHIAYAYRLKTANGIVCRFHDAAEPGGTAGKPIYQHLAGKDLINVVLAVIRYYGGIKLGAGGLTRAYGGTAKKAIDIAEFQPYLELTRHEMTLAYHQLPSLEHHLKALNGQILTQSFLEQVTLTVELPESNLAKLVENFTSHG